MSGTTEAVESSKLPSEPLAVLILHRSSRGSGTFRLSAGEAVIGAGKEADFVVEDAAVSRRHLGIRLVPEGVEVRDLESRNGSFFGGQRFSKMTLSLGSSVKIGETELHFEADRAEFEGTKGRAVTRYGELFGTSAGMQHLFVLLERLEGSLATVLVTGESGTGKELVARALHENSKVRGGPLVVVNCGALDRALLRSELFGYKKGAFTGAVGESVGAIGDADGGTLFLDEVGELPLEVQPMLLRVLESGAYARVGESKERPVKFRLVAATHRNLEEEVEAGRFREDLYYRLKVVSLTIPPLRSRREEIPALAQHLAEKMGIEALPESVVLEISKLTLSGNVRELRNVLSSYGALGVLPPKPNPKASNLEAAIGAMLDLSRPYSELKDELTEAMTKLYLAKLLEAADGNLSEASRISGLQRGYLRSLTERYGLREKNRERP